MSIQINKNEKYKLIELNHKIFSTLLVIFLSLLLIDTIWDQSVPDVININYILIITMISGTISVITGGEIRKDKIKLTKKDYVYIIILGITGSIIVWYKIKAIGNLAYLISIVSGILIILLSLLIFDGEEHDI